MNWIFSTHQSGVFLFLILANMVALANAFWLQRLDKKRPSSPYPPVAVLIPARNEEANLETCLVSLLNQTYPDFSVWVLDDHSSDRTGQIAANLADLHPRLHVLQGKDLPEGWLGKHWACQQLADASQGEILLFTDADTRYHPDTLRDAVNLMNLDRLDLLSAMPRQEMGSFGERLVVPYFQFAVLVYIPLFLARFLSIPAFSFAIGQFLLFQRAAYQIVGGHAAVRKEAVDDIALAHLITKLGLRWRLVDATRRVSCRMYTGFSEARQGFSKNMFAAFDYRLVPYLFVWLWCGLAYLEPPIVLLLSLSGIRSPYFSLDLAWASLALTFSLWAIPYLRLRIPLSLVLMFPLTYLVAFGIGILSLAQAAGRGSVWKGRRLLRARIRLF